MHYARGKIAVKKSKTLPVEKRFKYIITLFSGAFLLSAYLLWINWPTLLITTLHWQKEISAQLSTLLYDAQVHPLSAGISLMGLSFIYGLLHSLGPGHGKVIVSTYIATHPTKVKESLLLTFFSSLLQAVVAIALVSVLLGIYKSSMHAVNSNANYFITLSVYAVALLGLMIIIKSLVSLWKFSPFHQQPTLKINSLKVIPKADSQLIANDKNHVHDENCGCGHAHVVDAEMINKASSLKEYLMIVVSIGMRPCSGAIMVLLFSYMMNIYWLGILSAFAMAIGTVITTSTIAIMTITGKKLITYYRNQTATPTSTPSLMSPLLRLTGGCILLIMASLLLGAQSTGGISPVF